MSIDSEKSDDDLFEKIRGKRSRVNKPEKSDAQALDFVKQREEGPREPPGRATCGPVKGIIAACLGYIRCVCRSLVSPFREKKKIVAV